jgi:anti-sigma-K factor RskA
VSVSGEHDCGGDAAAYVLGALEPHEAEAFRRHLGQCAVCRDEVDSLQGVARALPMAAPQHPLPRRLRRRVMREVRAGPAPRRASRSGWMVPRAALAAAAVIAVAVVVGLSVSGSSSSGRLIQAEVTGIAGSAQLRVSGGHGELLVRHLSPPPSGHVYEVWLKAPKANPVPANVLFNVNANGSADVRLPPSLHGVGQVMVTPEPDGGSAAPTHAPVIVAQLT